MFGATIAVVAILTLLIFTLAFISFKSLLRAEKREIESGSRDEELKANEAKEKKKTSKAMNIVSRIITGTVALALLATSAAAITYRASGEQFSINNHISLVIVSDSMDGFYSDEYEVLLTESCPDAKDTQFGIGDILDFEKVQPDEKLVLNEVYGYKAKSGKTITHRLVGIDEQANRYTFRGDNTGGNDSYVSREQIALRYTGNRVQRVGLFVLFTQSGFGLYSFVSVIVVYVAAEVTAYKYSKMVKDRLAKITPAKQEGESKTEEAKDEKA